MNELGSVVVICGSQTLSIISSMTAAVTCNYKINI